MSFIETVIRLGKSGEDGSFVWVCEETAERKFHFLVSSFVQSVFLSSRCTE